MDVSEIKKEFKSDRHYRGQIVSETVVEASAPRFGKLNAPLSSSVKESLLRAGTDRLYTHQAGAANAVREGNNVVVVTGTASGKSLCYNIPVLEAVENDKRSKALYLFPTKALAQDQLKALGEFGLGHVVAATYDGDTPARDRRTIRDDANIVLSNFDMLHYGILPYHSRWGSFLMNCRFVVIDEMHTLRGVYGSNCANVLARLRRVLDRYMARTQYILTSATIGNPGQLARALIGQDVEVVSDDGSPRRRKTFVFWNPPFLDEKVRVRKSANSESSRVFTRLVENDVKTIVFSKSRQTAELIHKYADDRLKGRRARDSAFADDPLIAPYRAGYLPEERRDIEARFGDGRLRGVSSTNALELGLDIGGLDACVINGFPGTVSSFFQQAGRCGRSQVDSAVFFVGSGDPLDQHYLKHPRDLFGQPHEDALVDPGNESILDSHLVCAAYEFPLAARDRRYFGTGLEDRCSTLADSGQLVHREGRWFYKPRSEDRFPAANINIRSASQRLFSIIDAASGALMGTIDHANAFFYVHPGAIYLHQGQSYFVTELDLDRAVALVKPAAGDYYTQPRDLTDISVIETLHSSRLAGGRTFFGRVRVTTEVIGYQKKRVLTGELLGEETLDLPPQDFQTEAFWFLISPGLVEELELSERELAGGVHAAEHGAIAMLPFFAMCDRRDIGGVSTPAHPETGQATVFIYDGYQGGVGIAKRGYEIKDEYLLKTVRMIEDCDCDEGCPACVVSPKCGNFNEPLDKQAAVRILTRILAVNLARSNE